MQGRYVNPHQPYVQQVPVQHVPAQHMQMQQMPVHPQMTLQDINYQMQMLQKQAEMMMAQQQQRVYQTGQGVSPLQGAVIGNQSVISRNHLNQTDDGGGANRFVTNAPKKKVTYQQQQEQEETTMHVVENTEFVVPNTPRGFWDNKKITIPRESKPLVDSDCIHKEIITLGFTINGLDIYREELKGKDKKYLFMDYGILDDQVKVTDEKMLKELFISDTGTFYRNMCKHNKAGRTMQHMIMLDKYNTYMTKCVREWMDINIYREGHGPLTITDFMTDYGDLYGVMCQLGLQKEVDHLIVMLDVMVSKGAIAAETHSKVKDEHKQLILPGSLVACGDSSYTLGLDEIKGTVKLSNEKGNDRLVSIFERAEDKLGVISFDVITNDNYQYRFNKSYHDEYYITFVG